MDLDAITDLESLLAEERACVESLLGLTWIATDTMERRALTTMGVQAVRGCVELHERLEQLGAGVGMRIADSAFRVLSHERIDDRLRAFGALNERLAERFERARDRARDEETQMLLATLVSVQRTHAAWAERRAGEFTASRPTDGETSSPAHPAPRVVAAPMTADPGATPSHADEANARAGTTISSASAQDAPSGDPPTARPESIPDLASLPAPTTPAEADADPESLRFATPISASDNRADHDTTDSTTQAEGDTPKSLPDAPERKSPARPRVSSTARPPSPLTRKRTTRPPAKRTTRP